MNFWQKKLKLYKKIIISWTIVFGCFLVLGLVIYPAITDTVQMYHENTSLEEVVKKLQNKLLILNSVDQVRLQSDLALLLSAVPSDKSIATLISTLEGVGGNSGVTLSDITVAAPGSISTESAKLLKATSDAGVPGVLYKAAIRGDEAQINQFIGLIQKVRRVLGLTKFDITYDENKVGTAQIELIGYYNTLPQALGHVTDSIVEATPEENSIVSKLANIPLATQEIVLPSVGSGIIKQNPFGNFQ